MRTAALGIQILTYIVLGVVFFHDGNWRFGACQLLLAGVQTLVYL